MIESNLTENPRVVSRTEWLAARKELLAREKELTRCARRGERGAPPVALGQGREGVCV